MEVEKSRNNSLKFGNKNYQICLILSFYSQKVTPPLSVPKLPRGPDGTLTALVIETDAHEERGLLITGETMLFSHLDGVSQDLLLAYELPRNNGFCGLLLRQYQLSACLICVQARFFQFQFHEGFLPFPGALMPMSKSPLVMWEVIKAISSLSLWTPPCSKNSSR